VRLRSTASLLAAWSAIGCTDVVKPHLVCGDGGVSALDGALDLSSDPMNCGCVGRVCRVAGDASAQMSCISGQCMLRCDEGYMNCNGRDDDGCEVHTAVDVANCGICGASCSGFNGTANCAAGRCGIACLAGWGDCDRMLSTGCETDLGNSIDHCGRCGGACETLHAESVCRAGRCTHAACVTGFDDCDRDAANGCEANLMGDARNCGNCGAQCVRPNATPACAMSVCRIGVCNMGFDDCDRSDVNGCEVDLRSDVMNCGRCGLRCSFSGTNAFCNNGTCDWRSCNGGYADCDGNHANGCERSLNSDSSNCGGCGHVCTAPTQYCRNGGCSGP
jgi:hypothetical protein